MSDGFEKANRNSVHSPKNYIAYQIGYNVKHISPEAAQVLWDTQITQPGKGKGALTSIHLGGKTFFVTREQFTKLKNEMGAKYAESSASTSFITTWRTNAEAIGFNGYSNNTNPNQITLPLSSTGTFDFLVDWGDGNNDTITAHNQPETTHTYSVPGEYEVTMTGTIDGFGQEWIGMLDLVEVKNWGNVKLTDTTGLFGGSDHLAITATDAPDLSGNTTMEYWFFALDGVRQTNFANWDVSTIQSLFATFGETPLLDGTDFSNWNTSNVTTMDSTFLDLTIHESFGLENWDVSNVSDMTGVFDGATLPANFDLSGWCVTNIASRPTNFGDFSGANQIEPVWGTCP